MTTSGRLGGRTDTQEGDGFDLESGFELRPISVAGRLRVLVDFVALNLRFNEHEVIDFQRVNADALHVLLRLQ